MTKCKGCIHLPICSSREEKCQSYQTKADICRELKLEVLKNIEIGIESTGHTDQYSTGFCNALIWLRDCITGEESKFLEMESEE